MERERERERGGGKEKGGGREEGNNHFFLCRCCCVISVMRSVICTASTQSCGQYHGENGHVLSVTRLEE